MTVTVSALLLPVLSLTVSEKVSTVGCEGVVKLGVAVLAPLSVTVEPPVWVQAKLRVPLPVWELPLPSSVTLLLGVEVCVKPALATTPVVSLATVYCRFSQSS